MSYMRMPKTREEFEFDLLNAFKAGLNAGYAVDHTKLTEDENRAVLEFAESRGFKTNAVNENIYK